MDDKQLREELTKVANLDGSGIGALLVETDADYMEDSLPLQYKTLFGTYGEGAATRLISVQKASGKSFENLILVTTVTPDETLHELMRLHDVSYRVIEVERSTGIDAVLEQRGNRYGEFHEHARITQAIKRAMRDSPNWDSLPDDMKEALEMNAHKTGRILNGDINYKDSWTDIIGYTKLIEKRLKDE